MLLAVFILTTLAIMQSLVVTQNKTHQLPETATLLLCDVNMSYCGIIICRYSYTVTGLKVYLSVLTTVGTASLTQEIVEAQSGFQEAFGYCAF